MVAATGPPPKKRRVDNVRLKELWQCSALKSTVCPKPRDLAAHVQHPLPFQLLLYDPEIAYNIFAEGSPEIKCDDLHAMIKVFMLMCRKSMDSKASKSEWRFFYQTLFRIPIQLCFANALDLTLVRNRIDETNTSYSKLRPDVILRYDGWVLFRGEEKNAATRFNVPLGELSNKMRCRNPIFYGELPYVLGYATSVEELKIVAINRHLSVHGVLEFNSITIQKADVIKTFYNLSFLLDKMSTSSNYMQPTRLKPYTPGINLKRTLEPLDDKIRRTIKLQQCKKQADVDRLIDIYMVLDQLNRHKLGRTHLQTVMKLKLTTTRITVELGPIGFE